MDGIFSTTLENGLRVVLDNIPARRMVAAGLWFPFGSRFENPEQQGYAHFIEHMLFKGTQSRTYSDISRAIDRLGGSMNASTSKEITNYYVTLPSRHIGIALDVLADMYFRSTFLPKEFETEKNVILEEIRMTQDDPDELIFDLVYDNIHRGTDLAHSIGGTLSSISHSDRDSLYSFYLSSYGTQNAVLSLAGGLYSNESEKQQLLDSIEAMYNHKGDFTGSASMASLQQPSPVKTGNLLHHTKKLEQVQVFLSLPGQPYSTEYKPALDLYSNLMGSTMSSRLFRILREERGLAYSVGTLLTHHALEGSFSAYFSTSPEKLEESFTVLTEEMEKSIKEPIPEEEIREAMSGLSGSMEMRMEGTYAHASFNAKSILYFSKSVDWTDAVRRIELYEPKNLQKDIAELFASYYPAITSLGTVKEKQMQKLAQSAGLKPGR